MTSDELMKLHIEKVREIMGKVIEPTCKRIANSLSEKGYHTYVRFYKKTALPMSDLVVFQVKKNRVSALGICFKLYLVIGKINISSTYYQGRDRSHIDTVSLSDITEEWVTKYMIKEIEIYLTQHW